RRRNRAKRANWQPPQGWPTSTMSTSPTPPAPGAGTPDPRPGARGETRVARSRWGVGELAEEPGHVLMVEVKHDAPRFALLAQDEGRVQGNGVAGRPVLHPQMP